VFLRAAARVASEFPDARFVVIGDGPSRQGLEELTIQLGISAITLFMGARLDARALMAHFYTLVVPSRYDSWGLVIGEAMAAGVPIVATRVGGIPEQVTHGLNGLLVPPADPLALASAIATVLKRPKYACELGAAGRQVVSPTSQSRYLDEVEAVYARARQAET
jgi:glycosyltransferase involved in cell wall biosynthesis